MARITIDYTPAVWQGAGIGRSVRELVGALAHLENPHRYTLFTQGRGILPRPTFESARFRWRSSPISPDWQARLYRMRIPLPVEVWAGCADLYFASDFVLPPTLTRRTLLFIHDLSFVRVPDSASPSLKRYLDQVVPPSVRRATRILVNSQATAQEVTELYGVSPDRISQVSFGVEPRFFESLPLTPGQRLELGLPDRPYLLAVGTVQPRKNYERLFEAFAKLVAEGFDGNLAIVGGRGWLEAPIYTRVKQLGLQGRIYWLGFVSDHLLPRVYKSALGLVYISLYEGYGLPILEAMAAGIPVVTSDCSSMPEAAGGAAILVDPYHIDAIAEGIRLLFSDKGLCEMLVQRGLAHARSATWQHGGQQLLDAFEQTLA